MNAGGDAGGRRAALYLVLLLAATVGVFARGFENGWSSVDDDVLVLDNPAQKDFGARELRQAFDPRASRALYGYQYTPLSDVSYALDRRLFGEDPRGYHLQGLLFHAIAAAALFLLVRRLGGSPEHALFAAAVFALHPAQVEAVTWISGRRTALAGAFMLLAALAWTRPKSRAAFAASLACALLANLSKQSAVVTVAILAAVEWCGERRRKLLYVPHVALAVAFFWIGAAIGRREGIIEDLPVGLATRTQVPLAAIATYARMLVWPDALQPLYRTRLPEGWLDPRVLAGASVAAGGLALAVLARRRSPLVTFGVLLAGIALAPGAFAVGTQIVADRYLYLTVAGAAIAAGAALEAILRRSAPVGAAAGIGVAAALALATVLRVGAWHDDVTLFRDALAKDPKNSISRRCLGRALVAAGRVEEGELELRRAAAEVQQEPLRGPWQLPFALVDIGVACARRGDHDEAERAFRAALEIARPRDNELDYAAEKFARFYLSRGDRPAARRTLERAVERGGPAAERSRRALEKLKALP